MKTLFLALALLLACQIQAQTPPRDTGHWAPTGASWIFSAPAIGMELYYQFDYVGDTTIQGLPMKKIEYSTFNFPMPGPGVILPRTPNGHINFWYFYQNQDSVFWYDNGSLRLLYAFNTPAGGHWVLEENLHYDCAASGFSLAPTDSALVTAISSANFEGQIFEVLNLDANRRDWYLGGGVIKNIGSPETFFPKPVPPYDCTTDGSVHPYNGLACYCDSVRPMFATPLGQQRGGCQRLLSADRITNSSAKDKISFDIYPNPSALAFYVSYSMQDVGLKIQLTDLSGRVCLLSNVQNGQAIPIEQLPAGFYIVSLIHQNQIIANQKLIKQ